RIQAHEAQEGSVPEVELLRGATDVELLAVGRDERQRPRHRAARLAQQVEQAREDGAERLVARDDDLGAAGAAGDGQPGVGAHDASQGVESNGGAETEVLVGAGCDACPSESSCMTKEMPTHAAHATAARMSEAISRRELSFTVRRSSIRPWSSADPSRMRWIFACSMS